MLLSGLKHIVFGKLLNMIVDILFLSETTN